MAKNNSTSEEKVLQKLSDNEFSGATSVFLYGCHEPENALRLIEHLLALLDGNEPLDKREAHALHDVVAKAFRTIICDKKSADIAFGLKQGRGAVPDPDIPARDMEMALDVRVLQVSNLCGNNRPRDLVADKWFGFAKGEKAVAEAVTKYKNFVEPTYYLLTPKDIEAVELKYFPESQPIK